MTLIGHFLANTGLAHLGVQNVIMVLVGLALMFLGIGRKVHSLLLTAFGFGVVVANMPIDPRQALTIFSQGGIFYWCRFLVTHGILPALIFLGIGVLTDFSRLIANPRLILLAGAAQIGVLLVGVLAVLFGFDPPTAAAIAMIGGAHAPVAIYTAALTDPRVLGSVAIAAYACLALAPVIQPPIMRLLTTRGERMIRMERPRRVSRRRRILFPIVGFILGVFVIPTASVLLGMLFLGNLFRECGLIERFSHASGDNGSGGSWGDFVTVLLAFSVGLLTSGEYFLRFSTLMIFVLGVVAFALSTAGGILFAKLMNVFAQKKINPLIGSAGVASAPITARISQQVAAEEDPENMILEQALVPNLAAVIALALTAGLLIANLA